MQLCNEGMYVMIKIAFKFSAITLLSVRISTYFSNWSVNFADFRCVFKRLTTKFWPLAGAKGDIFVEFWEYLANIGSSVSLCKRTWCANKSFARELFWVGNILTVLTLAKTVPWIRRVLWLENGTTSGFLNSLNQFGLDMRRAEKTG